MMSTATMIIENEVTCVWLRSRDAALLLASGLLWATLLITLPGAEFAHVSPSTYAAILLTIAAMFLAWSLINRLYFQFATQLGDRRQDSVVRPEAIAAHFGIDPLRLIALQEQQHLIIYHGADGEISEVVTRVSLTTASEPNASRCAFSRAA